MAEPPSAVQPEPEVEPGSEQEPCPTPALESAPAMDVELEAETEAGSAETEPAVETQPAPAPETEPEPELEPKPSSEQEPLPKSAPTTCSHPGSTSRPEQGNDNEPLSPDPDSTPAMGSEPEAATEREPGVQVDVHQSVEPDDLATAAFHTMVAHTIANDTKLVNLLYGADTDGSNNMDQFEWEEAVREMEAPLSPTEAKLAFGFIDVGSKGSIDIGKLIERIQQEQERQRSLPEAARQSLLAVPSSSPESYTYDTPVSAQVRSLATDLENVLDKKRIGTEDPMDADTAEERSQAAQCSTDRADLAARAERLKQQRTEEERKAKELARKKKLRKPSSSRKPTRSRSSDRELEREWKTTAATKIQAVQRGQQARRQQEQQALAATKIQAGYRGRVVRSGRQIADDSGTREVKRMFAEVDVDGSGAIDASELRELLQKMGVYLTARELELAVLSIDKDGSNASKHILVSDVSFAAQGEIEFEEFHAWWLAGGLEAGGDYEGMVTSRSPALAELQVWLFRRGLADFTRCFLACGMTSMLALYELNHTKLTKLCIEDVGLSRRQADGIIKELMVRRDLLGYSSNDVVSNIEEQLGLDQKKRKMQHRKRRIARRDWHNRLEVNGDAHGPTYHNTTHKPLSCFCLPTPLGRVDRARERARGLRQPQDVQTTRRRQIAPTAGNVLQALTPTQRESAQQLAHTSAKFDRLPVTSVSSLSQKASSYSLSLRHLGGPVQESWSLPDISSSTSLTASSSVKSFGSSSSTFGRSPTSVNMFASVASGGRRRTNHGRISLSPKRSRHKHLRLSLSPDRSSYDPGSSGEVKQLALKQLDLEAFGGGGTSPTGSQGVLLPFTQNGQLQLEGVSAKNGQQPQPQPQPQPKTMRDWIRHSRNPMPEEFFLAGCPGL